MTGRYAAGKEAFGNGQINWLADDIRAVIVDAADYTVDLATDASLADIPSGARIATSGALVGKTNVGGVLDATDVSLPGVTGDQAEAVVVYKHTGVEATSTLISHHNSGTGFPLTPNGGVVVVQWNASGILAI